MPTPLAPLLKLDGVTKHFQGQVALRDAHLSVAPGRIHALVGQNGCGKSTLIKILAGYHTADSTVAAQFDGQPIDLTSTSRPDRLRFVHQDLGLAEDLSVVDNLALGDRYAGRWWLSDRRERRAAARVLEEYDVAIDPDALVASLTPAQRTLLAVVRSARRSFETDSACLLVLDEVTATLPSVEVEHVFRLMRLLRDRGASILYVTHRLGEVIEVADDVTVMRDGAHIATRSVSDMDEDTLVEMIVGGTVDYFYPNPPQPRSDISLRIDGIRGGSVADVSLQVHSGEILGVTGLVGSGYEDLLATAFGASHRTHGSVQVGGADLPPNDPRAAIGIGLTYAPADRKRLGAVREWTLRENVTLPAIPARGLARWLGIRRERIDAETWLSSMAVVPAGAELEFSALSGGNQQKVVLARWLRCNAKVLLLDEPTNGVDVNAKQAIYRALTEAAFRGTAVVLASSDIEELCALCDRVLVLRDGRVGAVLSGTELSVDRVVSESMSGRGAVAVFGG